MPSLLFVQCCVAIVAHTSRHSDPDTDAKQSLHTIQLRRYFKHGIEFNALKWDGLLLITVIFSRFPFGLSSVFARWNILASNYVYN